MVIRCTAGIGCGTASATARSPLRQQAANWPASQIGVGDIPLSDRLSAPGGNEWHDLTIRCLADGLAFPESPIACDDGSVLVSEMAAGRITRVSPTAPLRSSRRPAEAPTALPGSPTGAWWSARTAAHDSGSGPGRTTSMAAQCFSGRSVPTSPMTPQLQLVDAVGVSTLATEFTTRYGQRQPLVRPSDICVDEPRRLLRHRRRNCARPQPQCHRSAVRNG